MVAPLETSGATENGARLELVLLVVPTLKARVAGHVVHDRRLASLGHPPRNTLSDLQTNVAEVVSLFSQRQLEGKLFFLLVDEQDRPRFGRYEPLDVRHDHGNDALRFQYRVGGGDDITEHLEPPACLPQPPSQQGRLPIQTMMPLRIAQDQGQRFDRRQLRQMKGYARLLLGSERRRVGEDRRLGNRLAQPPYQFVVTPGRARLFDDDGFESLALLPTLMRLIDAVLAGTYCEPSDLERVYLDPFARKRLKRVPDFGVGVEESKATFARSIRDPAVSIGGIGGIGVLLNGYDGSSRS